MSNKRKCISLLIPPKKQIENTESQNAADWKILSTNEQDVFENNLAPMGNFVPSKYAPSLRIVEYHNKTSLDSLVYEVSVNLKNQHSIFQIVNYLNRL